LKPGRQQRQLFDDMLAPVLVAALDAMGIPADFPQDMGEGAAALAATPAIHQRPPALGLVEQAFLDVARDVLRHQRRAELLGLEHRNLLVEGADAGAFLVVQDRHADRAGQAVFGKLGRRASVDDGVELGELCYRRHALGQFFGHRISGQQRFERVPDVIENLRLGRGGGMQAVGLVGVLIEGDRFEQEGQQADFFAFGEVAESRIEILRILRPVVRRQAHADQQHARSGCCLACDTMAARLSFIAATGRPRKPSLAPSARMTTVGLKWAIAAAKRARPPAVVSPLMLALARWRRNQAHFSRCPSRAGQLWLTAMPKPAERLSP
jgi:hypothetical protein